MARRSPCAHLSPNRNISEVSENVASRNRGKDQKSEESYGGTKKLSGRRFDELSQHQQQVFQEIVKKLAEHFKSEKTIKRFCEWSMDEAPKALATWQETKNEALKCISERMHQFVQQWEDDKHEFKNAQNSLIQCCTERYDVMAEEIFKVEEQTEADFSQDEDVTQSRSRKSNAPPWLRQGLASVVVDSSGALSKLSKLGARGTKKPRFKLTKMERYKNSPCGYMSQRSRKCLDGFATQDRLLPFITEQLEDAVQFLRQIKENIRKLREGDEQLYLQLIEHKRSKTEIQEIYEPLKKQISVLQYGLAVYNVSEVMTSDFTDEELKCDEKWKSIIGEGSFSIVYKGILSREGQPAIKVALKRYREPLTTNNTWHFVDEERALR